MADDLDRVVARIDGKRTEPVPTFDPQPLDYVALLRDGIPPVVYVHEPYLAAGTSVWAAGASTSGKSMWALAVSCELSRRGVRVIYISQENPRQVDLARLGKLQPNPACLTVYHYAGFDFALPLHVERLIELADGVSLIVADTLSAVWSGDENDNAAIVGYDREFVRPVIETTGATVLTLDHTGHPSAFVSRKGVSAPRGASAKGQKADTVLEFRIEGPHEFSITHSKSRADGILQPLRQFEVRDDEDAETISLVAVENSADRQSRDVADRMAAFICAAAGPITTNALREAMKGAAGREVQNTAMNQLRGEDPPRVRTGQRTIDTPHGRQPAKAWWSAQADQEGLI